MSKVDFIAELTWRGMLHDIVPGTQDLLKKESVSGYIGFDPTADSLGIGHLAQIMTLLHFQKAGHTPIVLIGGATGMVGDPSGKKEERNLLDADTLNHNVACIKDQLSKFLDFKQPSNAAVMVNNYDWFKDYKFLDFIRDVGKHITISYMLAKDSVQKRLEAGMSFTEFSYQLVQGYDFYWLRTNMNVKLQMGGSDQWGNIVTGTEFIRRKSGLDAYALTTKLITKADGSKFGKSESGNIWLDASKTSPYQFYQFWLRCADEDAISFIKIFTLLSQKDIEEMILKHQNAPHERLLQHALAQDITRRVHGEDALNKAKMATKVLFGKSTIEDLSFLDEKTLESAFEKHNHFSISSSLIKEGILIQDLLAIHTPILASKGEAKRMIKNNGISIKKEKITMEDDCINTQHLLHNKYLFVQKGKEFYLISAQ